MKDLDYPALYRSAGAASAGSQAQYLWLIRGQYTLLFIAAWVSLFADRDFRFSLGYVIMIGGASALTAFMALKKPEKDWYGARALAESIKTSSWRYMMKAEPFQGGPGQPDSRAKFAGFLREILDANQHVRATISRRPVIGEQITQKMESIRSEALARRIAIYSDERVDDQRSWYVAKARWNRTYFRAWIVLCISVQLAALSFALFRTYQPTALAVWPSDPLLVAASALIGWVQIKKFNELASAYSLTAHEIGIVATELLSVSTEAQFSDFVNDAERAFSREHTQWIARQES